MNMRKMSRWLIISSFMALAIFIAYRSPQLEIPVIKNNQRKSSQNQLIKAKGIHLFYFNKNQKSSLIGESFSAEHRNNSLFNIRVSKPKGIWYKGSDKVFYEGDEAQLPRKDDVLKLRGNASFKYKNFDLAGDKFDYFSELSLVNGSGEIDFRTNQEKDRLFINSDRIEFWMDENKGNFTGNVQGRLQKSKVYQEGLKFKSSSLLFDQNKSLITLSGGLEIDKGDQHVTALYGDVFLNNYSKKLKYYVLYDDIEFTESFVNEAGQEKKRRAYAQKIEGFIRENKVVLIGAPEVKQENNVIRGYQITLYGDSEIVEVDESRSRLKVEK